MNRWIGATFVIAVCCSSCGNSDKQEEKKNPFGMGSIPPQLRGKSAEGGTPIIAGGNQPVIVMPKNMTPDDEIIFTDPDNPDAQLPELSTLLNSPKRGPWEQSEAIAKRRAVREGKPLLIWFTDSARSPMCKALGEELFGTPDFEKWATEKVVRLRVDSNTRLKDEDLSMDEQATRDVNVKNYVATLKQRYKVIGHPTVMMLNSSGEVIGRYRGYKRGDAQYFWGQLKHSETVSTAAYKSWRAGLEQKGYREWQDRKGRKVLAKLRSYSNGELVFIEPDGTRSQTKESQLSENDQNWIATQKKLRGVP